MTDMLESPMTYLEIWARDEKAGKAEASGEMIYSDVSIAGIEIRKRRMNVLWKDDLNGNVQIFVYTFIKIILTKISN